MLKYSTPAEEGILHSSRFLAVQVLLDGPEMTQLHAAVGSPIIASVSGVVGSNEGIVDASEFLSVYTEYATSLSQGRFPPEEHYRLMLSSVWTTDTDALYALRIDDNRRLVKVRRPVIQLQPHRFDYSKSDGKLRSMVHGPDTILWGVQFSFPQIFQDPASQEIHETQGSPNSKLYRSIQRWLREHSQPTPFVAHGVLQNSPIRLGKNCFRWIQNHPQLADHGLSVKETI